MNKTTGYAGSNDEGVGIIDDTSIPPCCTKCGWEKEHMTVLEALDHYNEHPEIKIPVTMTDKGVILSDLTAYKNEFCLSDQH